MSHVESKGDLGHPPYTTINERMVYGRGIIYVSTKTFLKHCREMGIPEETLKHYASKNLDIRDMFARGSLAQKAIQDLMGTEYISMVKRKMSCHHLFKPECTGWCMVTIRLDSNFIRNRLLVNKFKLTNPDACRRIIAAYNESLNT